MSDRDALSGSASAHELAIRLNGGDPWDDGAALGRASAALRDLVPVDGIDFVFDEAETLELDRRADQLGRAFGRRDVSRDFFVTLPRDVSERMLLEGARLLRSRGVAVTVDIAWPIVQPTVLPEDDTHWPDQAFLLGAQETWAAPRFDESSTVIGTNAWYAWRFPGGAGRGVKFADIERGWDLDHPELREHGIEKIAGKQLDEPGCVAHGTAALGIVCASDSVEGVAGIARDVMCVYVASHERRTERKSFVTRLEKTIQRVARKLDPGDVMLLEVQLETAKGKLWPVEIREPIFYAIRQAVAGGVIVIEPAGNGHRSIDEKIAKWVSDAGIEDPRRDSGAIVVGAAKPFEDHRRDASNFGQRVDCWSWDRWVTTCSPSASGATQPPAPLADFDGTSAAAAIVSGLAVALQGAYRAAPKGDDEPTCLDPSSMRALLASHGVTATEDDPALSGLAADAAAGVDTSLGRQPDLRRIIDEKLGLAFPYVRDHDEDVGEPGEQLTGSCPDVAIRAKDAARSEPPLVDDVLPVGGDAELHLIVRNRNRRGAESVVLDVYYAEGLDDPSTAAGWTSLCTVIADVPGNGSKYTVTPLESLPAATGQLDLLVVLRHDPKDSRLATTTVLGAPHRAWMERVRSIAMRRAPAGCPT